MNSILVDKSKYGKSRNELMAHLKRQGIDTRLLFNGMHRQESLRKYGCDCARRYPVTDMLADNGLYLPSGSGLTEDDIKRICDEITLYKNQ
jgi:perosamine synthetase